MLIDDYTRYQSNKKEVGLRCRILRKFSNQPIKEIAKEIGVTPVTINRFENGKVDSVKCFKYFLNKYGEVIFTNEGQERNDNCTSYANTL